MAPNYSCAANVFALFSKYNSFVELSAAIKRLKIQDAAVNSHKLLGHSI